MDGRVKFEGVNFMLSQRLEGDDDCMVAESGFRQALIWIADGHYKDLWIMFLYTVIE
jgi:hypothetical protein